MYTDKAHQVFFICMHSDARLQTSKKKDMGEKQYTASSKFTWSEWKINHVLLSHFATQFRNFVWSTCVRVYLCIFFILSSANREKDDLSN